MGNGQWARGKGQGARGRGENVHERVRKAHFGAVDSAIARALDDGEDVMVFGVENDALDRGLVESRAWLVSIARAWWYMPRRPSAVVVWLCAHLEDLESGGHDASAIGTMVASWRGAEGRERARVALGN